MHVGHALAVEPDLARKALAIRRDPTGAFPILSAKIKITGRCNLRCKMCALWREPLAGAARTDVMTSAKIAEILEQLTQRGLRKVHFSGGEVLLRDDFMSIVEHARTLGVQVNLTTNGTLLDKNVARALVKHRVHTVAVSIDSADPKTHNRIRGNRAAWQDSVAGLALLHARRKAKGRGPKIAVNTVVTRESIEQLDALYRLLLEWHVDSWRLLPLDTEIKKDRPTDEQWRELATRWHSWQPLLARLPVDWSSERSGERAAKGKYAGLFYADHICYAPWFNVFVDSDGNVYPCCMGKRDMTPCGTVLTQSIDACLDGTVLREIRCGIAASHMFPVCELCDDFLEENQAFSSLEIE